MPRATYVPITPRVLDWAIEESGLLRSELAAKLKISDELLETWLLGEEQPSLTNLKKLGTTLKRPSALFLLPEPPVTRTPPVEFRHPPGPDARQALNASERRFLREATRLQRAVAWTRQELGHMPVQIPRFRPTDDAESRGSGLRSRLGVGAKDLVSWSNGYEALKGWRTAVEDSGILVFSLPIGAESCRGFSVWDDWAPLIVLNTWWRAEARIFTLFHEYGHLTTRTNSACLEGGSQIKVVDPLERWCEEFSAAVILPWPELASYLERRFDWHKGDEIADLEVVAALSRRFNVSLRATTIRLIKHGAATWDLYAEILPASDSKAKGGGGSPEPPTRPVVRHRQYGKRSARTFFEALDRDILDRPSVASYLGLADRELDVLRDRVGL